MIQLLVCGVIPVLLCSAIQKPYMKQLSTIALGLFAPFVLAQSPVTVSTAPSNGDQVWYSLQNGVVQDRPLAEWDIAFEITGITGSILANTAKGVAVYKAPYALSQWTSIDTAGLAASWPAQHNSEVNWSSGAFNQGLTSNPFDLGWGVYNMVTHNITGDSAFVIKLGPSSWKKFKVNGYSSSTNSFSFTWSDLDGTNEQSNSLNRSAFAGRNFGYVSLIDNTVFDREPATNTWDLLFTKYLAFVPFPVPSMYPVAGVLQNADIAVQRVDDVSTDFEDWSAGSFSNAINRIGFDWKSFNQSTLQWEYVTDRVHFVQDRAGNIWKLVFTNYGGSANGDITFTQELLSSVGVDEIESGKARLVVYPNPSVDGDVTLITDLTGPSVIVDVMDMTGRTLRSIQLIGLQGLTQHRLDLSDLPKGAYAVRLQGQRSEGSTRLIIQ